MGKNLKERGERLMEMNFKLVLTTYDGTGSDEKMNLLLENFHKSKNELEKYLHDLTIVPIVKNDPR